MNTFFYWPDSQGCCRTTEASLMVYFLPSEPRPFQITANSNNSSRGAPLLSLWEISLSFPDFTPQHLPLPGRRKRRPAETQGQGDLSGVTAGKAEDEVISNNVGAGCLGQPDCVSPLSHRPAGSKSPSEGLTCFPRRPGCVLHVTPPPPGSLTPYVH